MPHQEIWVDLPQGRVNVFVGGTGPRLVVLHREYGRIAWGRMHERLAARFTVLAPALPGFDSSDRPAWLRNVADLSAVTALALDRLDAAPLALVGLGFGGWVAAEIAARSPARIRHLVLHAPMGIKPPEGEILDQFFFSSSEYLDRCFSTAAARAAIVPLDDDAVDILELNREMTTRVAWKPYMYDPALPHLLRDSAVDALLVTSAEDRIVPPSCARAYRECLPGAGLVTLPEGGHAAELETPEALADAILGHLADTSPARRAS